MKRKIIGFIISNAIILHIIPLILFVIFEIQASGVRKWDEKAYEEGFEHQQDYIRDYAIVTIDGEEYQIIDYGTEGYLAFTNSEYKIKDGGFAIYYAETEESIYVESMPDTFYRDAGDAVTVPIVELHKIIKYDVMYYYILIIVMMFGILIQPLMMVWLFLIIFLSIKKERRNAKEIYKKSY